MDCFCSVQYGNSTGYRVKTKTRCPVLFALEEFSRFELVIFCCKRGMGGMEIAAEGQNNGQQSQKRG